MTSEPLQHHILDHLIQEGDVAKVDGPFVLAKQTEELTTNGLLIYHVAIAYIWGRRRMSVQTMHLALPESSPNLSFRLMHCDMCGNCNILRHFLLFPLLLSEPPAMQRTEFS